ncbi:MAG: hypothetical protein JSR77_04225 [Planctomycetes bacterium]|nr:hypothetical protein [Planctomycetota bacterium]
MAQVEFGYDPTLGTLPEAQCWTAVAEPGNPAPRVIGGALVQGPTAAGPDQYWIRGDASISFDSGFTLETRIRVVSSDYLPDVGGLGRQRAGYGFQVIDSSGRVFGVWLGSDAILLQNNNMTDQEPAVPTVHMAIAGPVRTIRLEARNGTGRVLVDGTEVLTAPASAVLYPSLANRVIFGDSASTCSSAVELFGLHLSANASTLIGASGPQDSLSCLGTDAMFQVSTVGSGPFTFQWRQHGIALTDGPTGTGSVIVGANTPTLMISNVSDADEAEYDCKVSNSCGRATSRAATLTVCACLACPADFNQDGGIDGADVSFFFDRWEVGNCDADVNADGGTDGADVDAFFAAWEAGGCG